MMKLIPIFRRIATVVLPAVLGGIFASVLPVEAIAQTWSSPTYIGQFDTEIPYVPSFDPSGNAWVGLWNYNFENPPYLLQIVESNGVSGTWQQPVALLQSDMISSGPDVKADHAGAVNVVYGFISADSHQLQAFRYVPGTGWQGPVLVYASTSDVYEMGSAIDSNNNLVVVFAQGPGNLGPLETWSIVFSAATGTWGTPQMLSSPRAANGLWSLESSSDGANIMLVYSSQVGPTQDIYSWKYAPSTQSWTGAAVPGTSKPGFFDTNGIGGFGHLPLAVDSSGNATLLAEYVEPQSGEATVYGFRYENGQWGKGVQLLSLETAQENIDFLGAMAVDSSGIAVGSMATSRNDGSIEAFRYTPGVGWDTETVATSLNISWESVGVTFLGSTPGEAVVVYGNGTVMTSSVYLNGTWTVVPFPTAIGTDSIYLAQAPNGEDLFVFPSSNSAAATWLVP
jgi:hypothetical protein